jgi:hypothetical protein
VPVPNPAFDPAKHHPRLEGQPTPRAASGWLRFVRVGSLRAEPCSLGGVARGSKNGELSPIQGETLRRRQRRAIAQSTVQYVSP